MSILYHEFSLRYSSISPQISKKLQCREIYIIGVYFKADALWTETIDNIDFNNIDMTRPEGTDAYLDNCYKYDIYKVNKNLSLLYIYNNLSSNGWYLNSQHNVPLCDFKN